MFGSSTPIKGARKSPPKEEERWLESLFENIENHTSINTPGSALTEPHTSGLLPHLRLENFLDNPAAVIEQIHLQCVPPSLSPFSMSLIACIPRRSLLEELKDRLVPASIAPPPSNPIPSALPSRRPTRTAPSTSSDTSSPSQVPSIVKYHLHPNFTLQPQDFQSHAVQGRALQRSISAFDEILAKYADAHGGRSVGTKGIRQDLATLEGYRDSFVLQLKEFGKVITHLHTPDTEVPCSQCRNNEVGLEDNLIGGSALNTLKAGALTNA